MDYDKIDKDEIGQPIYWCDKHGEYFSNNCSECMLASNEAYIKREGIKEVVEWIEKDRYEVNQKNIPALGIIPLSLIHLERWQAKLKEWGISDKERVSDTSTE